MQKYPNIAKSYACNIYYYAFVSNKFLNAIQGGPFRSFKRFSKYAWIFSLKDKKSVTITNAFQSILTDSKRKPNKIWVGKSS